MAFYMVVHKQYLRITLTLLLQGIYTFLWTLLLVIPGIIKHYSYSMTSYVLHDNPELKYDDAIDRSIKLMKGHKMKLFLLDLSFIGWILLGIITCGIGMLWVYPYWLTSHAAFYNDLLEEEAAKTAEREPFVTGVEIVAPEYCFIHIDRETEYSASLFSLLSHPLIYPVSSFEKIINP